MLEVKGLFKSFGGVAAISDVNIDFPTGSLTAIIGPNGAGKSTFFNLISGGLTPDAGSVTFNGTNLVGRSRAQIIDAGIGRAFQVARIFPTLTVEESLLGAVTAHRRRAQNITHRFPLPEMRDRMLEVAEMLGLTEKLGVTSANLSHGDQKLLDIALALVLDPKVLLLDEPTAGMTQAEVEQTAALIRDLNRDAALIVVEHDMQFIRSIASRVTVFHQGRVFAEDSADVIMRDPRVGEIYLGKRNLMA